MKALVSIFVIMSISSSVLASMPKFSKCHYTIVDARKEGVLDMVNGGARQLIDPDNKVQFSLYYTRMENTGLTDTDAIEVSARISTPCELT